MTGPISIFTGYFLLTFCSSIIEKGMKHLAITYYDYYYFYAKHTNNNNNNIVRTINQSTMKSSAAARCHIIEK